MWAQFKQIMSEQKMFTKAITGFSFCKEVLPCVQYHPLVLLLALLGLWQLLIPYTNTPQSVCKAHNISSFMCKVPVIVQYIVYV